ncbi:MAG: peptidase dimerization domain-containing protein, partial [Desulfocucumaceae bacterium]
LGKSTLALTIISCSPGALSIIPDICTVSLDRRFIPGETAEKAIRPFEKLFAKLSAEDPEFKASIKVRKVRETSYTGYSEDAEKNMMAWVVEKDNPFVLKTIEALKSVGQNPGFGKWDFGTDASYVTGVKGIPTIGYSPMEEKYAHTPSDRCRIDYLVESLAGNAAIALNISG